MTYKLINDRPVIHSYTSNSQGWGHSMQGFTSGREVEFDTLTTYKVSGSCFSRLPIQKGDLISRDMQSGKIGLFEVQSAYRPRYNGEGSWPPDYYNFEAVFCGYYDTRHKRILVHEGYGIKSSSIKIPKGKLKFSKTTQFFLWLVFISFVFAPIVYFISR